MLSGRILTTLEGHKEWVNGLAFSPDGNQLASAAGDRTIKFWNIATGRLTRTLFCGRPAADVSFSPDGMLLAATMTVLDDPPDGQEPSSLLVWSLPDGELRRGGIVEREGSLSGPLPVAFSPDGKMLAWGAGDSFLVLDLATGRQRTIVFSVAEEEAGTIGTLAFSPDGRLVAVAALESGTVKLWSSDTLEHTRTLQGPQGEDGETVWPPDVWAVAFSPDGKALAVGSADGPADTVKLWDVQTGGLLRTGGGYGLPAYGLAISPDARVIASTGGGVTIRLWDAETLAVVAVLDIGIDPAESREHDPRLFPVAFSPSGKQLAAGGSDGIIRLWTWGDSW
jgi:WD40 repeat protein